MRLCSDVLSAISIDMIAAPPQSWQRNSSSEPEPEPEPSSEGAGKAFRRAKNAGRGFGLFAERPISADEVLREEMPLVAAQDPAGAAVLPACIVCLRPCGTPRQALRLHCMTPISLPRTEQDRSLLCT